MRLSSRHSLLSSFLKVAEERNISRAADALFLSQPAVTQQMRTLERELGTVLFERTGKGVCLTGSGHLLLEYARKSISLLDEAQRAIEEYEKGISGRLVIGAGTTTSIFSLPPLLSRFRSSHPGIDIVVRTGGSRQVAQMVLEREVEIGLVTSRVPHPDLLETQLFEERILLVAPRDHPLSYVTVDKRDLSEYALIVFPQGTGFRAYLDSVLREEGISMRVKMETDSVEAIKSFVAVGLGVSFLPQSAVEHEIRDGVLEEVVVKGLPVLRRLTSAIHRRGAVLSRTAISFMECLPRLARGEADSQV